MCQTSSQQVVTDYQQNDSNLHPPKAQGMRSYSIEDALSKTNFGSFNYFLIFITSMIMCAVFMESCVVAYIFPVSQCDLKLTTNEKGLLGAVAFFGMICSSHLWGFLADTQGRRRLIIPTLLTAFVLSVMSSVSDNFYLFATLRGLNGFFMCAASATIYAYVGEFHDTTHRSRAIMAASFIYSITLICIPFVAFAVINHEWQFEIPFLHVIFKPWRLFIVVSSLPGLVAAISLLFTPESPKFVLGKGDQYEAIRIIKQMYQWNMGKDAPPLEIDEIREESEAIENRLRALEIRKSRFPLLTAIWNQTAPFFQPPYFASTALICTLQFWIFYTNNGLYLFFNEIINQMSSSLDSLIDDRIDICDLIQMNQITAVNVTATENDPDVCITQLKFETLTADIILETLYAIGFAFIGLLSNRLGKFPILFFIFTISGLGGVLLVLTQIPIAQITFFVLFMCSGIAGYVVSAVSVDLYPTSLRAMAICLSFMVGRFGGVAGSNLSAILFADYCASAFYVPGLALIGCAVLSYFIPNIHQQIQTTKL